MTYLAFDLTRAGTFAYHGKGEVDCDLQAGAAHPWTVRLRLSREEADEFDAWRAEEASLRLTTDLDHAVSVLVEAVERHDRGGHAILRGAGYCPVPEHAGPKAPPPSD